MKKVAGIIVKTVVGTIVGLNLINIFDKQLRKHYTDI